ncbi:MAG: hypothetical protein JNK01_07050 [Devosia sp.]|nr:hypothetical protein [Devosia sp.]
MLRLTTAMLAAALVVPAVAGEGADIALRHLYAGTASAGISELASGTDAESRFGMGLLQFVQGIERFGQGLYRHGFTVPESAWWPLRNPLLVPVPTNPTPEPLDYEKLRGILDDLSSDLDEAQKTLIEAGVAGDYVIPVDVMKVRVDIDGDGRSGEGENVGVMLGMALGITRIPGAAASSDPDAEPSLVIGLDRADAIWLAGYSNVIALEADFLLAHDFHTLLDTALPHFFPKAGLEMSGHIEPLRPRGQYDYISPDDMLMIVDMVAAFHAMNWQVVDRDRLKNVYTRLKSITSLSRQNWQAILSETDNNQELLPNPHQRSVLGGRGITDAQIKAWLATLDTVDKVFDGKLLIPHWRFARGLDLRSYFETAGHTDPVLMFTGQDALPYLRDGPIASDASFRELWTAFGQQWLGYAFWFN